MQDSPHFLQLSQKCWNSKKSINNSKNNNEFYLKNDFTKINNTNGNYLENANKKVNNKNFASFKNSYKTTIKVYSATTKICLWLFLFVVCLAVTIGFGYANGSNGNGSLKVTPTVETVSAEGETVSWSGSGTATSPYIIGTSADLVALATNCNNLTSPAHYEKKYFKMSGDITVDSSTWTPIACDPTGVNCGSLYFSGNFDGDGHTISFDESITQELGEMDTVFYSAYYGLLFGRVVGGVENEGNSNEVSWGNVRNVNIEIDSITICDGFQQASSSIDETCIGGIVGTSSGKIINCSFIGKVSCNVAAKWMSYGVIAGYASKIIDCSVDCVCNIDVANVYSNARKRVGVIVGAATEVSNCCANVTSSTFKVSGGMGTYCGLVAGYATTVKYCHVNATMESCEFDDWDGSPLVGLIVGYGATSIGNCSIKATITALSIIGDSNPGTFNFITYGGGNSSNLCPVNNCIVVANIGTLTANMVRSIGNTTTGYNCVVVSTVGGVGQAYQLSYSTTATSDTTNGLYSVAGDDADLKDISTYTGRGRNGYTWNTSGDTAGGTGGNAWDITTNHKSETGVWFVPQNKSDYPMLKQFYVEPPCNITLNVTTNLSGSTSGTVAGSGSATAASDKFIIYRFDENGNLVNQFVVSNGTQLTFEVENGKTFTIMINYKLYMVTTIDGENALQKTFTPSENKTINISITAPAGVNNWIVI